LWINGIKKENKMSRPYSDKFLIGLQSADEDRVGIQLAKVCVESSLPLLYVAEYFGVTRMSVHKWFRGDYIKEKNCIKIQKFIKIAKEDLEKGLLPATSIKTARIYLNKEV
tara:strand:- start:135 stop:467 length:333 start_codon:yes stop_codon:yes gene_type:complete